MATAQTIATVGEGNIWPTTGLLAPLTDCIGGNGCGAVYFEGSAWIFVILTLIIGGGCALVAGRAVATGWRSVWIAVVYGLLLSCAVRFLHFGLLRGTLISPYYFVADAIVLIGLALTGYRYARATQMSTQYPWLYRRSGPFGWTKADSPQNS